MQQHTYCKLMNSNTSWLVTTTIDRKGGLWHDFALKKICLPFGLRLYATRSVGGLIAQKRVWQYNNYWEPMF